MRCAISRADVGAGLAKAAYAAAARSGVDHAPARVFVFMALAPLDHDPDPAYFGGAAALATEALGRQDDDAGLRAVGRAISALRGARLVDRQGRGRGNTVRYPLLDGCGRPLMAGRLPSGQDTGWSDAQRPVDSPLTGRSAPDDRTLSVGWSDAERPTEEERRKEEETRASALPVDNSLPRRTCRRHESWEHSAPCRACAADRRAAEAHAVAQRPQTMSPRVLDCGVGRHKRLPDGTCIRCENRDPLWEVA
jgi:DNA-binding transcriptional ArsR family regulator